MQFKGLLLNTTIVRNAYRTYVSTVNVNVKSFVSIRVQSKDSLDSSEEVKLTLLNGQKKVVDAANVESLNIVNTSDTFKLDCDKGNELSAIIDVPVGFPEVRIEVIAEKSSVQVEHLQAKSIEVDLRVGDISTHNLKCDVIKAATEQGNITAKSLLLGKNIHFKSKNGNVFIAKSQGDILEVEAASIKVGSCYNRTINFTSTHDTMLKNVHGNLSIKASGKVFKLSGFAGNLNAQLNNEDIELQLSELTGNSKISSTNPNATIKLGLADDVVKSTNFAITANCHTDSYVPDLIVCNKKKNSFEIKRENPVRQNELQVSVKNGKSLELSSMSWIDFLSFK